MQFQITASQLRVSSVLNRDATNYGKKHLVDNNLETCWNSDQGSPQWIQVDSTSDQEPIQPTSIRLMFQGGFAGKECELLGQPLTPADATSTEWHRIMKFYPEDINTLQEFPIAQPTHGYKKIKVVFMNSTDFYGRVTVYQFNIIS
ncbi:hypothetical protein BDV3_000816 [Batrachochytrium dendrobatidis]|nr:hypothetical protein O5D80_000644 [Batrachochytrium dendrobatidis]KAK5672199.1 hypothetical protein QVD99_002002 [Batrachochytrium dendrobatidis]